MEIIVDNSLVTSKKSCHFFLASKSSKAKSGIFWTAVSSPISYVLFSMAAFKIFFFFFNLPMMHLGLGYFYFYFFTV